MARKRMFSLDVVDSDIFLEMPLSTQAIYSNEELEEIVRNKQKNNSF